MTNTRKLALGQLLITPGAKEAVGTEHLTELLAALFEKHACGDWGDVSEEDKQNNDEALESGDRILSAYNIGDTRIWIITEYDRSATTVLLPDEY